MAFRYSLQTVLRLRASLEKQAEQRLQAAVATVAKLRNQLQALDETHGVETKRRQNALTSGALGSELQFYLLADTALLQHRVALQAKLLEAEHKRVQQVALYQAARQKREILQALRDRAEAAYKLKTDRREQQQIDESFLMRAFLESLD